ADVGPPASPRQATPGSTGATLACSDVTLPCPATVPTVTATDLCDGPIQATCVPPSGSALPVGQTMVVCTARNAAGNQATCGFRVTVVDTLPPLVNCPANITAPATSGSGAVVTYVAGASDACGIASFVCSPPSGSTFPLGVTTVTCSVRDTAGNSNSCSFTVTVTEPNQPPVCMLQASCALTF